MLKAGTVLEGKYRLVGPIGQGGMGSVWRAEHVKLGRGVAIKFVHAVSEPTAIARFLREARIAAQVRHRHVVSITDFGSTVDGAPYLAMELLDGETLSARMAREPRIAVLELFEIVAGVLSGLEAVHAAGIVHRDVKPANIVLVQEVDGVVPKVVDFGTSRATAQAQMTTETITATGMLVGTPYYMSEEQARGRKDVDGRTDLYSMGVILYEALSGRVPFDADTMHELMRQIVTGKPVPLSTLRPDLPAEAVAVVEKAMARERGSRYQTARELRHALLATMGLVSSESIPPTVVREAPTPPPSSSTAQTAPQIAMAATAQLDRLSSAPTLESGRVGVENAQQRQAHPRWLVAAAAVVVVLACGGAGLALALRDRDPAPALSATSIAPPSIVPLPRPVDSLPLARPPAVGSTMGDSTPPQLEVTIRLHSLPSDGVVHVDGEVATGPDLRLPRDGRLRRIEVTAPGRGTWSVEHSCTADGEYRVDLPAVASNPAPTRPPRAPVKGPGKVRPGKLLGDPGF